MGKKIFISIFILILVLVGIFFYFRSQVYYSRGKFKASKSFEIKEGEGNAEIAQNLSEEGIISGKIYFYYYLKSNDLVNRIMPGVYELSGNLTIPEIVRIITNPEEKYIKITFPEGWDARRMAERLSQNNLPGEKFLEVVQNPGDFKKRYSYLSGDKIETLEGYLFPDTYFFKHDISAENIIGRLLDTFDQKAAGDITEGILGKEKTFGEIVIMASILEREVQTPADMKIVSGIFWKRLSEGQRLQSDATLSYFLNDKEDQHSGKDLEIDTPYNSYRYAGLPPTPIGNPGKNAIEAAMSPEDSLYNFFLTINTDGKKEVIYSKTFEEHVANRRKYGL